VSWPGLMQSWASTSWSSTTPTLSLIHIFGALAAGGRISVIGVASGAGVDLNLLTLMQKRASVRGSTLRARSTVDKAIVAAGVTARVLPLLADGRIRVPVAATYPLADVEAAYQRFADGAKLGKVVLLA